MDNVKLVRVIGKEKLELDIRFRDGNLAASGALYDVGARDCKVAGQCWEDMIRFFPEIAPLQKWHLNNMNAACEHQESWDLEKKIKLTTYKLKGETSLARSKLKDRAIKELSEGKTVKLTADEMLLMKLDYYFTGAKLPFGIEASYTVEKTETKNATWVYPSEHKDGILNKPCEVCGYKYGSQWLKREIPADMVALINRFLNGEIK